ncbi:MAG: hypothetical protein KDD62_10360 [Bdellovibrionales bacterium]|nr:hypothetical protein [Bdellovibrionales bacterium]
MVGFLAQKGERGLFVEGLIFFVFFVIVFGAVAVVTVAKQNEWRDNLVNNWNVQRPGNEFVAYWNIAGRWQEKAPADIVPDLEAWRLSSQQFSMVGARFDVCTFIARVSGSVSPLTISADAALRTASCGGATNLVTNPEVRKLIEAAYVPNPDISQVLFLVNTAFEKSTGEIQAAYLAETSAREHVEVPWVGCLGSACGTPPPTPSPSPSLPPTPTPTPTVSPSPTDSPTATATEVPTVTAFPTSTVVPTLTATPTIVLPTESPVPTVVETVVPTVTPTDSPLPSATVVIATPTVLPTIPVTPTPTTVPVTPSPVPTLEATIIPTSVPTVTALPSNSTTPTVNPVPSLPVAPSLGPLPK